VNKTLRTLSAAALAGGLVISLAAAASAQQGAPPQPNAPGAARHFDRGQMRARFEERRQHRQQVLHDALGLRADQEGAWQAFTASTRRPDGERGRGMRGRDGGGDKAELTTPQRLDRMAQRMAERQQRFAQRADAIKRFYAVLDGRQQKTFDALISARGEGMGGPGGMGGGWGRHGGRGGPPGERGPGGPPDGERG
jgi:hypothetical protein